VGPSFGADRPVCAELSRPFQYGAEFPGSAVSFGVSEGSALGSNALALWMSVSARWCAVTACAEMASPERPMQMATVAARFVVVLVAADAVARLDSGPSSEVRHALIRGSVHTLAVAVRVQA
jgi:hypothetical protein